MPLAVNFDFMTSDKIIQNQDNEHRWTIKWACISNEKRMKLREEETQWIVAFDLCPMDFLQIENALWLNHK